MTEPTWWSDAERVKLQELIDEARAKKMWLRLRGEQNYFAPHELEAWNQAGHYLLRASSFELINPYTLIQGLEMAVTDAQRKIKAIIRRIEEGSQV